MMRPPAVEDVRMAQSHLVLLKSKMRQRRAAAARPPFGADAERLGQEPSLPSDAADPRAARGRFERVSYSDAYASAEAGYASQARPPRGGVENSPRATAGGGVSWDPPSEGAAVPS